MEFSLNYEVIEYAGKNCITNESGKKIYNLILDELQQEHSLTLDFTGVSVFASPFFNAAVGPLFKDYSRDVITSKVEFKNLNQIGKNVLELVMENSERFFMDAKFRDELPGILKGQEEEE